MLARGAVACADWRNKDSATAGSAISWAVGYGHRISTQASWARPQAGEDKMDRRSTFGLIAATVAGSAAAVQRAEAVGEKKHRLAIHVDQGDIAQMNLALGNASNV